MVKLNLKEFAHYDLETVKEFITLLEENELEILVPKLRSFREEDKRSELSYDYIAAAFTGDKICGVVETFGYYTPDPFTDESISFRVKLGDIIAFCNTIYPLVFGLYGDVDSFDLASEEQYMSFVDDALAFYEESLELSEPCNTWGLVAVAKALQDGLYQ